MALELIRKNILQRKTKGKKFEPTNSSPVNVMNILYQLRGQNVSKDVETTETPQEHNIPLTEESLTEILYRGICMLRLREMISNLSKSRTLHFRDLGFMDDVAKALHCASDNDGNRGGEDERRLESVSKSYGFVKCPVQGDEDCLLAALFTQLERLLHTEGVSTILANHLPCIGLLPTTVILRSEEVVKLRKLMVAEWLGNESEYGLRNLCMNEQEILEYEESGVFGGALGDAMPVALANVLHLPIVIFTSIDNFPVTVSPREQVPNAQPLYLAYTRHGPWHYDIAELQQVNTTSTPSEIEKEGTMTKAESLPNFRLSLWSR